METKTDMSREAVTHRLTQMEGLWLLTKALTNARVIERNGGRKNRGLEMQTKMREILSSTWTQPAGDNVSSVDRSHDKHIGPVLRILVGSRSPEDLIAYLERVTTVEKGVEAFGRERLHDLAVKLLELNVTLD